MNNYSHDEHDNHNVDAMYIRERITELREKKGVSEHKMSLDLGRSKSYIHGIMACRALPSVTELFKICRYLGVTPKDFFDSGVEHPILINEAIEKMLKLNESEIKAVLNILTALVDAKGNESEEVAKTSKIALKV